MLSLLLASAIAVAGSPPDAGPAPPPPAADAAAAPAPAPSTAPAAPAAPAAPSIDSILKSGSSAAASDTDEEPAAAPPAQGPVPYNQLDTKAYDQALRSSAADGRTMAGALDGGWTLAASDGQRLYRFQFVGHGPMETADGAWRDLAGGPGLQGSGFVDQVGYAGDKLTLRFFEASAGGQVEVSVKPAGNGPWSGELKRGATVTQITFKKD